MKTAIMLILALSFSQAFAQTNSAKNYQDKVNLVRTMGKLLQVNFGNRDWYVNYLKGVDSRDKVFNVEVSDSSKDAMMSSGSSKLQRGSLQISIQGTEYYHSYVMGNHPEEVVSFNINFSQNDQIIDKIEVSSDRLDVTTVEERGYDGRRYDYYQRLIIDRSSRPLKMKISNWRPYRLEDTKTVYIESSSLNPGPIRTKQSGGL